jgi:hypothetical protein
MRSAASNYNAKGYNYVCARKGCCFGGNWKFEGTWHPMNLRGDASAFNDVASAGDQTIHDLGVP